MAVLVMNPMKDLHCNHMVSILNQKGIPYLEFGSPQENDYAFRDGKLLYNGTPIEHEKIQSVYYRGILQEPEQIQTEDQSVQYIRQVQFSAQVEAIKCWLLVLHQEGTYVINPPRNTAKYYQLYTLQQAGIPLPKTCVTSSPQLARSFISEVKQAVCKPLPGGSFCRKVTSEVINQLDLIGNEPVIFQEEIPGQDVRVNMLDGRVLSAHIIQKSDERILDYRTDPTYHKGEAQYKEVKLPDHVIAFCHQAMIQLGLTFSGIDLRKTPDNEYILIECNSMPAYLDIELKTNSPITEELVHRMAQNPQPDLTHAQPDMKFFPSVPQQTRVKRGESLFHYYDVMRQWSKHELEQKNRIILDLNHKQQEYFLKETGKRKTKMEIEKKDGRIHILRVW